MTESILAVVSPRSVGGLSIFDAEDSITPETAQEFNSEESVIRSARNELQRLGFKIENEGPITISISGSPKLFQNVFGVKPHKEKVEMVEGLPQVDYFAATPEETEKLLEPPQTLRPSIEGIVMAHPAELFESPLPPLAPVHQNAYRYFTVPDDIAVMLRASRVHRLNGTGRDVVVAMIDSGQYAHPFFNWHGYRVLPTLLGPGQSNPGEDLVGHGTGESANIFAAAPDISLRPIKGLSDAVGSFNVAIGSTPKPHIITNSWGYNVDNQSWQQLKQTNLSLYNYLKLLEATVSSAIANGIVVCFSCGNGTKRGFPSSHPDVISVGGVHVNYPDLSLEASSYASSFASTLYPGRRCPDVCGLTGKAVKIGNSNRAPSILLPVQPGASLDAITPSTGASDDGWGLFSGTSAACPQVAGVAALLLQKKPGLSPKDVKKKLVDTARDVTTGTSGTGESAGPGKDDATGAGLVDAKWSYITTFGDVAAEFISGSSDKQREMLETGQMPHAVDKFFADAMDTLRSR
ncbi:MAG: S8 family serine peptidase [Colwellia sp.]|nr:S8 family serine peptidase [Colwellia sp.]